MSWADVKTSRGDQYRGGTNMVDFSNWNVSTGGSRQAVMGQSSGQTGNGNGLLGGLSGKTGQLLAVAALGTWLYFKSKK